MRRTGDVLHRPFQGAPVHNLFHTPEGPENAARGPGNSVQMRPLDHAEQTDMLSRRQAACRWGCCRHRRRRRPLRRMLAGPIGTPAIDTRARHDTTRHVTRRGVTGLERCQTATKPQTRGIERARRSQ
jgi:hypothetical protein